MVKLKKFFNLLIISHLVFLLKVSFVEPKIQSRIVNGSPSNIDEEPSTVQLLNRNKFFCGGSLVSKDCVVTAAHCVKTKRAEDLTVVSEATYVKQGGVRTNVSEIKIHQRYINFIDGFDVAVLKLSSPVNSSNIQTANLCTQSLEADNDVTVYGWGKTGGDTNYGSQILRSVTVKVIDKSRCLQQYKYYGILRKSVFCAFVPGGKDACGGDSGGPAMINGELCGIVSWGAECGSPYYPGIYTDVSKIKDFIIDNCNLPRV